MWEGNTRTVTIARMTLAKERLAWVGDARRDVRKGTSLGVDLIKQLGGPGGSCFASVSSAAATLLLAVLGCTFTDKGLQNAGIPDVGPSTLRRDAEQGKAPSTQAGEFVREEIEHIREGKRGARSTKQAIAMGLSEARRAGIQAATAQFGEGV